MKTPILSIFLPILVFGMLLAMPHQATAATQATSTFVVG